MIDSIKKETEERMQKKLYALKGEFSKIRTSRATPSILEHIVVSYYGSETPLNQLASVTAADQSLIVSPWDKGVIPHIEKAIFKAELGLNPVISGDVVRVPMPPLSEERRKEFVKIAKAESEKTRVAVRNIRRDVNNDIKKYKELSEDDERRLQDLIQKLTDKYIELVDKALVDKEKDLLAV